MKPVKTPDAAPRAGLTERELAAITRRIVRAVHPEMIVLFGSRVYGKPRPNSDLDLLVVSEVDGTWWHRSQQIVRLFPSAPVTLDVHAYTPSELTHRLEIGDDFIQEIVGRGKRVFPSRAKNGFVKRVTVALKRGQEQPMDNTEVVSEWIDKAEGNFNSSIVLARQRKRFNPDDLCWACEQCVEKYLKAFLVRHRVKFERNHDLDQLYEKCLAVDSDFRLIKDFLNKVVPCSPNIRYPGHGVDQETARASFQATKTIRKLVRARLGLR